MPAQEIALVGVWSVLVLAHAVPVSPRSIPVSTPPTISLLSTDDIAAGCPVAADTIITVRHIVLRQSPEGEVPVPLVWTDQDDQSGTAVLRMADNRRDVAWLTPDRPLARTVGRADQPPRIGARVVLIGRSGQRGFVRDMVSTVVFERFGPVLVLKKSAGPGWSGACVIEADSGLAVGIHVGTLGPYGIAMGIWGEWGEHPQRSP